MLRLITNPPKDQWPDILARACFDDSTLLPLVTNIMNQVKADGDDALYAYTNKFDGVLLDQLYLDKTAMATLADGVPNDLKTAIRKAADNIRLFHASQREEPKVISTMPGVQCWRKSIPIQKVGLYIPGGTAPLFSTLLMLAIPAQIAGCNEIVVCTPPTKKGQIDPSLAFVCQLLEIDRVFLCGGAQAIGAMTYGTETIPKVDKIFGPGNQYVTAAKMQASQLGIAIDMPAGPSEVLVWADDTALPDVIAADLLSQAEHGIDSQVILVCNKDKIYNEVNIELEKQCALLPRKALAEKALENSMCIILSDYQDQVNLINEYAPEHLIINTQNYSHDSDQIVNAGSIFLGPFSAESAGDYASGTNHTLPTNGYARAFSGVSLDSFVKKITYQEISSEGLQNIGPIIEIMAEAEQLQAHSNAIKVRLKHITT